MCNDFGYQSLDAWTSVCVVFNNGDYWVYVNGDAVVHVQTDAQAVNSHSDTTVGFVAGKDTFFGCFDDVSLRWFIMMIVNYSKNQPRYTKSEISVTYQLTSH